MQSQPDDNNSRAIQYFMPGGGFVIRHADEHLRVRAAIGHKRYGI